MSENMKDKSELQQQHREEVVQPKGIRAIGLGINALLFIAGVVLMTVGAKLNQHLAATLPEGEDLPKLWGLGILPVIIAVTGILSLVANQKKWLTLWLVFCTTASVGAYIFFTLMGYFDPARFGVTIQVFGHCQQKGQSCFCRWHEGSYLGVLESTTCSNAKYTNTLYITQTLLVILCLACTVIAIILGCIATCCIKYCVPQFERHMELHTTIYGAHLNNLSMRQQIQATSLLCPAPQYLLVPSEMSPGETTSTCDPESSYVL